MINDLDSAYEDVDANPSSTPGDSINVYTTSAYVYNHLSKFLLVIEQYFASAVDFRAKLLLFLIIWLFFNVILIRITWSHYGDSLSEMFLRTGEFRLFITCTNVG